MQPQETLPPHQTWRPLRLFNLYRLILSGAFLIYAQTTFSIKSIGQYDPALFESTTIAYFLIAIVNALAIHWRRPGFHAQVYLQIIIDFAAITLLMHASGGVQSGLGMLIIVAVAGGSILLPGMTALGFAAIASLLVLGEHIYIHLSDPLTPAAYTQAGLLGAAFFATALLAHALSKRVRESEALAERRGIDLANMEQLTQYIIQQMQTGVAVVDEQTRLWQINESAQQLLNIPSPEGRPPLAEVCQELAFQQRLWLEDSGTSPQRFRPKTSATEVLPHFAKLGDHAGTLVFLEDTAAMSQQAQQLKLASLGRLAGSIAHEIRNPLGAISHAGQLLAESKGLDKHDLRLTEIICSNSRRMNNIIENILQLGRRNQAQLEVITLKPWLEEFIEEFRLSQNIEQGLITLEVSPEEMNCEFDPSQLQQILWNLCQNGIRYSLSRSGSAQLILRTVKTADNPAPYLDIIDFGPGVPTEDVDHLFEPFFTTDAKGTGLGLYIAKELAECNYAHLNYFPAESGGSCFRITFADPRRRRTTQ